MHLVGDVYISFVNRLLQFADDRRRKTGQPAHEGTTEDFNALGRRVLGAAAWEGREAENVNV